MNVDAYIFFTWVDLAFEVNFCFLKGPCPNMLNKISNKTEDIRSKGVSLPPLTVARPPPQQPPGAVSPRALQTYFVHLQMYIYKHVRVCVSLMHTFLKPSLLFFIYFKDLVHSFWETASAPPGGGAGREREADSLLSREPDCGALSQPPPPQGPRATPKPL